MPGVSIPDILSVLSYTVWKPYYQIIDDLIDQKIIGKITSLLIDLTSELRTLESEGLIISQPRKNSLVGYVLREYKLTDKGLRQKNETKSAKLPDALPNET